MSQEFLSEPERSTALLEQVDVLVVGGGPAGIAAAVAAARAGASVSLVERYGFFGGMATAGWTATICGLYYLDAQRTPIFVNDGFAREFAERLVAMGGCLGAWPHRDTAVAPYTVVFFKLLCDALVSEQPNISVHLHSTLADVLVDQGLIRGVMIQNKRGRHAIGAKLVIDATGDADVATFAGVPLQQDELIQYPSMMFAMQDVDFGEVIKAGAQGLKHVVEAATAAGEFTPTRRDGNIIPTLRGGEVYVAMTRVANPDGTPVDASDPVQLTRAELEGRRQAVACAELLVKRMPGFENAYLADIAPQLGVRETRKIVGEVTLQREDILGARKWDDAICNGAWPIECHLPEGETEWSFLELDSWYQIPYRSLVPVGIDNLFAVGRCISADHDALASTRVMGNCFAIGQAAGIAAAQAAQRGQTTRELDVAGLQAALRGAGVKL
jgi:hypothetical protein